MFPSYALSMCKLSRRRDERQQDPARRVQAQLGRWLTRTAPQRSRGHGGEVAGQHDRAPARTHSQEEAGGSLIPR